ncbi:MAG: AsmA family protein [Acidobacteriia bacterium]|nr:AsmA family protein [Terriglobia bacterium]
MNRSSFKKVFKKTLRVAVILLLVVVILSFIVDITPIHDFLINRFSRRIETALTHAMGRSVKGINLNFTVISGLGFNLENVYVEEAPGFGSEPFLYADRVHFVVSWRSLLLGRFELSRITLRQASLNLVRNAEGRWNFETWFAGSVPPPAEATIPGPRAQGRPSPPGTIRPLPLRIYLDGDRINFKDLSGPYEKKVFILTEVTGKIEPAWFSNGIDFDVKMKPTRTDVAMENSGSLRLNGSLGPFPTSSFWSAGIQGQARLEKFPYSDVFSLLTGRTTYLHGLFDGRASFNGPLNGPLHLSGAVDLLDLHSWAALPREQFHSATLQFPHADLRIGGSFTISGALLVVGTSQFTVTGGLDRLSRPAMDFMVVSEKFMLDDALNVARGFTSRIPPETHLRGEAKVEYRLTGPWGSPVMSGRISSPEGRMESRFLASPVTFGPVKISLADRVLAWDSIEVGNRRQPPVQFRGSLANLFAPPQWTLEMTGSEVEIEGLEKIGRSLGFWPLAPRAEGVADFALHWGIGKKPADRASLTGSFSGHDITLHPEGANDLHMDAVKYEGKNDASLLTVTRLTWGASMASGNLQFHGLDYRQGEARLSASVLDVGELLQLGIQAGIRFEGTPSGNAPPSSRRSDFHWTGTLSAMTLQFNRLRVNNLRSDFEVLRHSLLLDRFSLEAYGGSSQGHLHLDWPEGRPRMRVEGNAENMNLDTLTALLTPMDSVVEGNVSGEYAFTGEKQKGQSWRDALSGHVRASVRDLRNVGLKIPLAAAELRSRLNISSSAVPRDTPFTLDLDLDYTPETIKIGHAHLMRGDFKGTFSGTCSRTLELDLAGTAEKSAPRKGHPATPIPISIRGPVDHVQITLTGPAPHQ